ncbi:hypothetical protein ALC56_09560 [Trachymyrmex septentrionalis]|uniref:Uncharacterized protein n=1 Tax=Trachymyrmex septentrionalis TaxID=34720 RepID=A0A151JU90_9HYME|nr:hypothetical protein ALC56_09560 [Trachymyrmex septentrionalis]
MSRLRTARTVEKDRCKLEGISLRPEAPNEPGVLNLKGSNWVSVPGGRTLTPDVPVHPYTLTIGHGT